MTGPSRGVPKGFFPSGTYDLFLTHFWRYTDGWQALVGAFDEYLPGKWRNWSLPWYDTSIDGHTDEGRATLERLLQGHISMAEAVILLPETNDRTEGKMWLSKELTIARQHKKSVIGVLPLDGSGFPDELVAHADLIVDRDPRQIIMALDRITRCAVD